MRGATQSSTIHPQYSQLFQSTLPVRGATPLIALELKEEGISIHAPREGSDGGGSLGVVAQLVFQSTLPVRGATLVGLDCGGR